MDPRELTAYLSSRAGIEVELGEVRELGGETSGAAALKGFGYGRPLLVSYRVGSQEEKIVLHRMRRNAFGRERSADRVAAVWLDFNTFNALPRHAPALDMVAQSSDGRLLSIGQAEDLLLITGYQPGEPYAEDLLRIREQGGHRPLDLRRVEALAAYLAEIHDLPREEPMLWRRRLRDLVGNGEGIFGQTDSFPPDQPYADQDTLRRIEELANRWRWKLKPLSHRMRQVHGDFHPFNVLFAEGTEFHVLDRSRGAWGEPADDLSAMTINYLFFSLQRWGSLTGPFEELHTHFWTCYLDRRPDDEMSSVIQPWLAWRALVLANPVWYPDIAGEARRKLLAFARNVLEEERYQYREPNQYLEARG